MAANRIVDKDVFFFKLFRACQGTVLHNIVLRNFLLNCTGSPRLFFFGGKLYRTGIWYDEPESVLPIALKISSPILGGFQLGIAHKEDPVYLWFFHTSAFLSIGTISPITPTHAHVQVLFSLLFMVPWHWHIPWHPMPFSPPSVIAKVNN